MFRTFGLTYKILLGFCLILLTSCASVNPPPSGSFPDFTQARHLVFVGFDGWGGKFVPKADMPTVKRMMEQGASSIYQYNIMPSNSRENWTALFSGTPPGKNNPGSVPTIFTIVNEKCKDNSAFFYEWDWLNGIASDEITDKHTIHSNTESAKKIAAYITEKKPVFTAVVFNEPDSVGHNKRWGSDLYYAKLAELDSFLAIIEQAVIDAGIYDDTVFVLSSDHGGALTGHGFNLVSHRRIPLVFYGSIIKEGFEIPAKRSICDIAPTMAVILDLDIPPEWIGQPILGVFQ